MKIVFTEGILLSPGKHREIKNKAQSLLHQSAMLSSSIELIGSVDPVNDEESRLVHEYLITYRSQRDKIRLQMNMINIAIAVVCHFNNN